MPVIEKNQQIPLASRMRPRTIEEFVGQEKIIGRNTLLWKAVERGVVGSVIFYGPPGSGKTTLASIIVRYMHAHTESISAVAARVSDLRDVITEAQQRLQQDKKRTVVVVDEIHRFNKTQQDVLLPYVEDGTVTLIGLTTENPYFEVIKALISRSRVYRFVPLEEKHIQHVIIQTLKDKERGLGDKNLRISPDALTYTARMASGDARSALNALELASSSKIHRETIHLSDIEEAFQQRALRYDRAGDEHYDTVSAFIKSMRGSDPDAALFWLHTMLAAGEHPEFIVRRMLIFASEDIGNADPHALMVAAAAAQALDQIGLPEAEYSISQAALYLASAPKSDAVKLAMKGAKKDIDRYGQLRVPSHLKNAPVPEMKRHGASVGYQNPHRGEEHVVRQQYLPDELVQHIYYEPTEQGFEREIKKRIDKVRKVQGKET